MKKFESTGIVYGHLWGGGKAAYQSKKITSNNKKNLLIEANKKLLDGSLDAGNGYECLTGALLNIKTITTKLIKGKKFINEDFKAVFIGKLTENEKDFLIECVYN